MLISMPAGKIFPERDLEEIFRWSGHGLAFCK
jgi:hypothetical protein